MPPAGLGFLYMYHPPVVSVQDMKRCQKKKSETVPKKKLKRKKQNINFTTMARTKQTFRARPERPAASSVGAIGKTQLKLYKELLNLAEPIDPKDIKIYNITKVVVKAKTPDEEPIRVNFNTPMVKEEEDLWISFLNQLNDEVDTIDPELNNQFDYNWNVEQEKEFQDKFSK
nr:hypothetical protein [Crucivirus sp.]